MAVCYNKLWKILIDKNMSKTQLIKEAKTRVSPYISAKKPAAGNSKIIAIEKNILLTEIKVAR